MLDDNVSCGTMSAGGKKRGRLTRFSGGFIFLSLAILFLGEEGILYEALLQHFLFTGGEVTGGVSSLVVATRLVPESCHASGQELTEPQWACLAAYQRFCISVQKAQIGRAMYNKEESVCYNNCFLI